ncbi:MAG: hypothetical protein J5684_04885 [Eubacterium sp.]|nr:hypothetical protein [Eubacterium sp.]
MKTKKRILSLLMGLMIAFSVLAIPSLESKAAVSAPSAVYEVSAKGKKITFCWQPVQGAVRYGVKLKVFGSSAYLTSGYVTSNAATFSAATPGMKYSVEVTAVGSDGKESYSYAYKILYAAPAKPKNLYLDSWKPGTGKPEIGWSAYYNATGAIYPDGYQVQISTLANKKIGTFNKKGSYPTFSGKSIAKIKNAGFKVKIRSYVTVKDAKGPGKNLKLYSAWSDVKSYLPQPVTSGHYYTGSSTATLNWEPIKNATSYTIYKVTQSGQKYKYTKYQTVDGSVTSVELPRSLGKVAILPTVKVGAKTFKAKFSERRYFYGVTL